MNKDIQQLKKLRAYLMAKDWMEYRNYTKVGKRWELSRDRSRMIVIKEIDRLRMIGEYSGLNGQLNK